MNQSTNTTASIDLAQLDRDVIERAIRFLDSGMHTIIARDTMANELRKLLARRSLTSGAPAQPFMYGIMTDDGKPHIDEACVDSHPGNLQDAVHYLNERAEEVGNQGYRVVPMYLSAPVHDAAAPIKIEGLGRMTNEDDGYLTLQFKDEDAACAFMQKYGCSVEVDDMPEMRDAAAPSAEAVLKLLSHIEDVVDDANWEKIDSTLWNAVTTPMADAAAKTEQDRRILLDTIGDLGEALLKTRDWLNGNPEAVSYINKSIALAGIRPPDSAAGAGSAQPAALDALKGICIRCDLHTDGGVDVLLDRVMRHIHTLEANVKANRVIAAQARAALTQQAGAAAPSREDAAEGWKLVPVEPTDGMVDAYLSGCTGGHTERGEDRFYYDAYGAMLDAAPLPAHPGQDGEKDAQRLDFLDTNVHRFRMGWEIGAAPVGCLSARTIIMGGKPIREAIDAAMAAAQQDAKGGA